MFTIEGDVWSFGIVLSEICSLGNNPYLQFRTLTGTFVDFLLAGGRMECGRTWPPFLHGLMEACWAGVPADRPTFARIRAQLDAERGRLAALPAGRVPSPGAGGTGPSDGALRPAPISDVGYQMPTLAPGGATASDQGGGSGGGTPEAAAASGTTRIKGGRTQTYQDYQMASQQTHPGGGADYQMASQQTHPGGGADYQQPKRSSDSHCPEHAAGTGAKEAEKGSKFQRGKRASVYLGFTDGGGGGDEGSTAV